MTNWFVPCFYRKVELEHSRQEFLFASPSFHLSEHSRRDHVPSHQRVFVPLLCPRMLRQSKWCHNRHGHIDTRHSVLLIHSWIQVLLCRARVVRGVTCYHSAGLSQPCGSRNSSSSNGLPSSFSTESLYFFSLALLRQSSVGKVILSVLS